MYENLGVELPGPTQAIVNASDFLLKEGGSGRLHWAHLRFSPCWVRPKRIPPVKRFLDILTLKMPLFGEILIGHGRAMGLLMANLIGAGVGIVDVLNIAKTVSANSSVQLGMDNVSRGVVTGRELSELFAEQKVFPIAVSQFVAVGERTGNIEEMLTSLAKYYEEEFDAVVEGLSTVIEPIMIVVVGGMIGAWWWRCIYPSSARATWSVK